MAEKRNRHFLCPSTARNGPDLFSINTIVLYPADTKRFEGIDSEFKELMKEAINVPMAVDACGVDGRAEGLKSMMQRLEMCQKSLNEYLDMKKKVRAQPESTPESRSLVVTPALEDIAYAVPLAWDV